MEQQVKQERLQGRLGPGNTKEFRQERRTLQLATVDEEGRLERKATYLSFRTKKVTLF